MADNRENITRSFNLMESTMESMWDMCLIGLGSLYWTQDQVEQMVRQQLSQSKAAREESIKLVEELSKQLRNNEEQFQKMIEDVVANTYDQIEKSRPGLFGDLIQQMWYLGKKAEAK